MEITEYSTFFYICILLGAAFGLIGGWMMQAIAEQIKKSWFNTASLLMLLAVTMILAAAFIILDGSLIYFLLLFTVMSLFPAMGFLAARHLGENNNVGA